MPSFADVVPTPQLLMGVKAVWGPSLARVLSFGPRGTREQRKYFQIPRSVAQRAQLRPFVLMIGGGRLVDATHDGCVLHIAKIGETFGETRAFVSDSLTMSKLEQWPVAVVTLDIWDVTGHPSLTRDLKFPDNTILENAFDNVIRPEQVDELWKRLLRYELDILDLPPILHFRDPDKLTLVSTKLPKTISKEEGDRVFKASLQLERDRVLPNLAKDLNKAKHGGSHVCEACGFSHEKRSLFDAHHLVPLAIGQRLSVVSDFAVLCPTCHRIAHFQAPKLYDPLSVAEIRGFLIGLGRFVASNGG